MKRDRKNQSEVICGNQLRMDIPEGLSYENLSCRLTGTTGNNERRIIPFTPEMLSKHLLLLGGIGTGKTNAFNGMISQLKAGLTEEDVMVIFDTKGDFYNAFYQDGDIVISNDETATGPVEKDYWNLFNEVAADGRGVESITEIAKMIFAEACEKTNQVFFPNAARGIFEACVYHFFQENPKYRSNYYLMEFINSMTSRELREMLERYPRFRAMTSYISADESPQTQGVLSELQRVCRDIFIGKFADVGGLSIRNLVKEKDGKTIFIEYDLSIGQALSPIYSMLFDLAIKEALGRKRSSGNVYFITDEFRLLPYLQHIDDAVNFGRSLGVKFMIGLQNVEQMYENYGEERARSILSGFQSIIAFRLNDAKSREHVQGFFGKNRKLEAYIPMIQTKGMVEENREGMVVEDWDITQLKTGQAIVGLPEQEPFLFQFDVYE